MAEVSDYKKTKKFKYQTMDGLSDYILFGVDAENVDFQDGKTLEEFSVEINKKIEDTNGDIPTKNSQLENDSNFITNAVNDLANYYLKKDTYTKEEVNELIQNISVLRFTVVDTLPTNESDIDKNHIYLVPNKTNPENTKDEYIYVNGEWEPIGSTSVDLSNYYKKKEIDDKHFITNESYNTNDFRLSIGVDSSTTNESGVAIGAMASAQNNSVIIGFNSFGNANSTVIGSGAHAHANSIAIGNGAATTKTNQMKVGSGDSPINEIIATTTAGDRTVAFEETVMDAISNATTSKPGFMSSTDKAKLDGIAEGANKIEASTTIPKAPGTAASGSETKYAKGDHVHPEQTSVSGNAGSASKLLNARTITLSGGVSGSTTFDGSENKTITTTLANAGATTVGGIKMRLDGDTLYITNDGTNP